MHGLIEDLVGLLSQLSLNTLIIKLIHIISRKFLYRSANRIKTSTKRINKHKEQ